MSEYLQSPVPFIMMGIYICIVIFLSYHATLSKKMREKLKNQTFEEYYTAGKSMPAFIVGLVTIVTFYSGTTFTGRVGFAYNFGFVAATSIVSCSMVGVIMFFLSEKIWPLSKKYRLSTLSDLMELRYQTKWIKLLIALTIVSFNIIWLITEIRTLGLIVNIASANAVPVQVGSAILFAIIILYVATGGIRSVAAVDSFSSALMLAGSVVTIIFIVIVYYGGDFGTIFETVRTGYPEKMVFDLNGKFSIPYWVSSVIVSGVVMLAYPSNYMGICLAKSVKAVKKSAIATSLSGPWLIVYIIIGYAALGLTTKGFEIGNPEAALLEMVSFGGNAVMLGLVTTFILAAALGTLDSTLISLSGLISNDIITNSKRIRTLDPCIGELGDDTKIINSRVEKNAKKEVRLTRIIILCLGTIAFCFSLAQLPLMVLMVNYATNGIVQVVPLVIGGIYWKKATPVGAITALISGVGSYLLFEAIKLNLGGFFLSLPALGINICVFVVVSLLTYKKYYAEKSHMQNLYDDFFLKGKVAKYLKENH